MTENIDKEVVMDKLETNPEFDVHMLNDYGKFQVFQIAKIFNYCLNELKVICPPSREFSIVKTKFEEACFFAKKSIAINPDNWETS